MSITPFYRIYAAYLQLQNFLSFVKKEIFDTHIKDKYFIEFVSDDRNQVVDMWRDEFRLPCFQVYYGDF